MKIKKIEIKGFRGIKEILGLDLQSQSCLIYGQNGSGKSSIADAIEWFYFDRIEHLSSQEIDRKGGISALRNVHLRKEDQSYVSLSFTKNTIDCKKILEHDLRTSSNNNTEEFSKYIENSKKENLILRYKNLSDFVNASKGDKLKYLLEIIGFENVLKIRDILKKLRNEIERKIKSKNFDNEISRREGEIMEKLTERVVDDDSFVRKINELVSPLKLRTISSIKEMNRLLEEFKSINDSSFIKKLDYLERARNSIKTIQDKQQNLYNCYEEYFSINNDLLKDAESIKQLALENLWRAGTDIIQNEIWQEDKCPLCYQGISLNKLNEDIENRLTQLGEIKKQKINLQNKQNEVQSYFNEFRKEIISIQNSEYFKAEEFSFLREFVTVIDNSIKNFEQEISKDVLKVEEIEPIESIKILEDTYKKAIFSCEKKIESIQTQLKGQEILELHSNITLAWERYKEIKKLKKEKELLEKYLHSMTQIYNEFIKELKEQLDQFINMFSSTLNEYYTYMHPGENISLVQIKLIEEEDNLTGLTIEYIFHNNLVSPPQKYLSESHINSLGIALFLTSVKAFNKINKFFVLDDIISSFDNEHRKRLSDLLLDKFRDYQIIILTHEKQWFDLVKRSVKNQGWYINVLKWADKKGTYFAPSFIDLRSYILGKFNDSDELGLGNLIRQYLEDILKKISEELEVKMPYKSNEKNEQRMCHEMLSYLKSEINKQQCNDIFDQVLNRLLTNSLFIADKGSHYDSFKPSIGDCKAFWDDVMSFESLFFCPVCKKFISVKFYDKINRKISCSCKKLTYDWKE